MKSKKAKKSNREILQEIGFLIKVICKHCNLNVKSFGCCNDFSFEVFYKEDDDDEWFSEEDAIHRIEQDGRSEEYFSNFPW